jgi:hypothetical protein
VLLESSIEHPPTVAASSPASRTIGDVTDRVVREIVPSISKTANCLRICIQYNACVYGLET